MVKLFSIVAVAISLCSGFDTAYADGRLPIMQLVSNQHEAQIKVMVARGDSYSYQLLDGHRPIQPVSISAFSWGNSQHVIHHLSFNGLQAQREYTLQVKDMTKNTVIDRRKLRTAFLAADMDIRFVVASCMYDKYEEQKSVWSAVLEKKPHLILMIGDNVYADKDIKGYSLMRGKGKQASEQMVATPAELWRRYAETRETLAIFQSERLIPVHAVWDDHDYGMNNGDRDYPFKHAAKAIFKAFFHGHASSNVHMSGLGVGSHIMLGDFSFFMLDNRFFRSPNKARTVKNEAHFGQQQLAWLLNHLHGRKHAFVVAGNQMFADYHRFESFATNHPNRFKDFVAQLKAIPTKLLFLSGDRHLSEIMELPAEQYLGYKTYEFTSSPIHAKLYPSDWDKIPNRLQKTGVSEQYNFLLLNVAAAKDRLTINTKAINHEGKVLFAHDGRVDM